MLIGVPKEIKTREFRVGLVPASVAELTHCGHRVMVETGAGWVSVRMTPNMKALARQLFQVLPIFLQRPK